MKVGDKVRIVKDDDNNFIRKGAEGTILKFYVYDTLIHYYTNGDGKGNKKKLVESDFRDIYGNCYRTKNSRIALLEIKNWKDVIQK